MKLHLWVSAPDHDDMDLAIKVEKLSKDRKPFFDPTGATIAATGYMRASMRQLDTLRTTEVTILHIHYGTKTETRRNRSAGN